MKESLILLQNGTLQPPIAAIAYMGSAALKPQADFGGTEDFRRAVVRFPKRFTFFTVRVVSTFLGEAQPVLAGSASLSSQSLSTFSYIWRMDLVVAIFSSFSFCSGFDVHASKYAISNNHIATETYRTQVA
jgi:hypothetical protein